MHVKNVTILLEHHSKQHLLFLVALYYVWHTSHATEVAAFQAPGILAILVSDKFSSCNVNEQLFDG